VPLLLTMKEDRLALTKAVDSGDTDLGITFFLIHLPLADHLSSISCPSTFTQTHAARVILPSHRGWRFASGAGE
jgi:hypothetical protein